MRIFFGCLFFGRRFGKIEHSRIVLISHFIIYMDLVTDGAKASAFVNGITPADMQNQNPAMEMAATASAAPALSVAPVQG